MPHIFITTLVTLLNHIINTQYIPETWKYGVITAICKPNKDNTLISSYRPITQLSSISKLLEKNGHTNKKTLRNKQFNKQ